MAQMVSSGVKHTPYMIAERGNPSHTLGDHGLPFEVVGPDLQDGGPTMIAACPSRAEAERVMFALAARIDPDRS